jgi:hypothetical protein
VRYSSCMVCSSQLAVEIITERLGWDHGVIGVRPERRRQGRQL